MILGFDTETSGLWRSDLPAESPSQPHLLSLAARLVTPDGKVAGRLSLLIKPTGWSIEPGAMAKHRITEQAAYAGGIELAAALIPFRAFVQKAREIVAFNLNFDRAVITRSLAELHAKADWWHQAAGRMACAMESAAPLTNLPGKIKGEPKFPSLEEAHNHFYPERAWRSVHNADADCEAAVEVWLALKGARDGNTHRQAINRL